MREEPVVVARFSYRHEAEFARSYLEAAGIDSAISADDAGGIQVALSFSNSVRLLVRAEDAARAREVLEGEYEDEEEDEEEAAGEEGAAPQDRG